MIVLIRADGGTFPEIGTGHIVRSLLLADFLQKTNEFKSSKILFATRTDSNFKFGHGLIKRSGYEVIDMHDSDYNSPFEKKILLSVKSDLVIFDRLDVEPFLVNSLKENGTKVVIFDDERKENRLGDLYINSLLQNVNLDEKTLHGNEYLILPKRKFEPLPTRKKIKKIFSCFGGYDVNNFSSLLINHLLKINLKIKIDLVVSNLNEIELKRFEENCNKINQNTGNEINLYHRPDNFYQLLNEADISIVSGGMMAFESVQYGIPTIGVAQYEHQKRNLRRLENLGVLEKGNFNQSSKDFIFGKLGKISMAYGTRQKMSKKSLRIFDGFAIDRVGKSICSLTH
tara:strand:- start:1469 stop:2494 length:1026 start_codon:yes stop_codon:yes gene_type:complete